MPKHNIPLWMKQTIQEQLSQINEVKISIIILRNNSLKVEDLARYADEIGCYLKINHAENSTTMIDSVTIMRPPHVGTSS